MVKQKSRELKAKWTMEPNGTEAEQFKTEFEIECAKLLQEEIDWEILSDILVECGWIKVDISPEQIPTIVETWVKGNVQGKYKVRGPTWVFESEKDAMMFILRWK